MFHKPPPIEIGTTSFDDVDLLGRAELAHQLSEVVDRIQDPLVLALDGDWGTGKSVFLKLWVGEHTKRDGKSRLVYFDAFAHDFLDDLLASLVVRLMQERTDNSGSVRRAMSGIMHAARKLALPAARTAAAVATAGMSELGANAIQAVASEAEATLDQFWNIENARIQAINEFRESLRQLAEQQRIVFIIDELDRCRPDYSLGMLEIVKHFFNVDNVHFVLGVNLSVLRNSITLRYGAGLDADLYLQKFINATFGFRDTRNGGIGKKYIDRMLEKEDTLLKLKGSPYLADEISTVLSIPNVRKNISLRSIERILTRIYFLPKDINRRPSSEKLLITFLAVAETSNWEVYHGVRTGKISEDELHDFLFLGISERDKCPTRNFMKDSNILRACG
jgi:hypothetical protein